MATNTGTHARTARLLALALFFFELSPALAAPSPSGEEKLGQQLGDCNWQVTYRGRRYDLSPLTRETLSRPIESDIRYALERVPEAGEHLRNVGTKLKEARGHTMIASVLISGVLATLLLQSRAKNNEERREYQVAAAAGAGFFVTAALFSWRTTSEAKQELVRAVDAFNERSQHKIEPAGPGAVN